PAADRERDVGVTQGGRRLLEAGQHGHFVLVALVDHGPWLPRGLGREALAPGRAPGHHVGREHLHHEPPTACGAVAGRGEGRKAPAVTRRRLPPAPRAEPPRGALPPPPPPPQGRRPPSPGRPPFRPARRPL